MRLEVDYKSNRTKYSSFEREREREIIRKYNFFSKYYGISKMYIRCTKIGQNLVKIKESIWEDLTHREMLKEK